MPGRVELALGIVGPGLVGKALIGQIQKQYRQLEALGAALKVVSVSNSRKMVIADQAQAIDLHRWQDHLAQGIAADLDALQERLATFPNPVLIDCTASDVIPAIYSSWLKRSGGHVVTPNKRLGAGRLSDYNQVMSCCRDTESRFFYEATVGAGLPVISSLQGLLRTGDEVQKIEGVFSGTLSYIFNSFGPDRQFSDVVAEAKIAGYTEPDPRDDLSGMDVARKVVILARECGLQLELSDVKVQSLVPDPLKDAASAEAFMTDLNKFDGEMAQQAEAAASEGRKLCYVGCVDVAAQRCTVSLEPYPLDHPFAQLSGSDNVVAFTTSRYSAQPLVVRGPGAGADVTAAGVFSDLVLLARALGARC